jgi:hypothetical protein
MKNDYDIAQIYREMELHLISSMQRNLGKHLKDEIAEGKEWKMWQAEKLKELKRYQRQNKDIVNFYTSGLSKDIADILKEEFKQGHKSELNKYNKLFDKNISDSFFKLDDRKANTLIKVVNDDLDIANKAVLRMMNDTYRQTIHKAATFANTGVMTQKQAVDMATKDFLSRGLAVIEYKDGKRVNIASYSQMAVRTASQRAMLMGEGEFRKSIGETLVIISKHGTACKLCQPHEGNVYIDDVYSGGKPDGKHKLLSDAMEENLFHPNCRHGVSTYYGLDDEEEQETTVNVPKENNNEDAARIDREIQKEKRKVAGFQSPDNLKTAQQRLKELEAQKANLKTIKGVKTVQLQKQDTVVNGKNIIGEFKKRTDKFDFVIEDVINYQGFDGVPKIVSDEEFKKAMKESNFYAERTYSANSKEILEEYRNQLYRGKWYVDCSTGGAQYGQGMYCAASYDITDNKKMGGIGWEMSHYQTLNKDKGNPFAYTEGITLDKSAKILELPHNEDKTYISNLYNREYMKKYCTVEQKEYVNKYIDALEKMDKLEKEIDGNSNIDWDEIRKKLEPLRIQRDNSFKDGNLNGLLVKARQNSFGKDAGVLAVEMGYDAINAIGHGTSGSYTVILNRTKVIFREGGSLYGN